MNYSRMQQFNGLDSFVVDTNSIITAASFQQWIMFSFSESCKARSENISEWGGVWTMKLLNVFMSLTSIRGDVVHSQSQIERDSRNIDWQEIISSMLCQKITAG